MAKRGTKLGGNLFKRGAREFSEEARHNSLGRTGLLRARGLFAQLVCLVVEFVVGIVLGLVGALAGELVGRSVSRFASGEVRVPPRGRQESQPEGARRRFGVGMVMAGFSNRCAHGEIASPRSQVRTSAEKCCLSIQKFRDEFNVGGPGVADGLVVAGPAERDRLVVLHLEGADRGGCDRPLLLCNRPAL
jgi:hypothetical protein